MSCSPYLLSNFSSKLAATKAKLNAEDHTSFLSLQAQRQAQGRKPPRLRVVKVGTHWEVQVCGKRNAIERALSGVCGCKSKRKRAR